MFPRITVDKLDNNAEIKLRDDRYTVYAPDTDTIPPNETITWRAGLALSVPSEYKLMAMIHYGSSETGPRFALADTLTLTEDVQNPNDLCFRLRNLSTLTPCVIRKGMPVIDLKVVIQKPPQLDVGIESIHSIQVFKHHKEARIELSGSDVLVYVPENVRATVAPGDKVLVRTRVSAKNIAPFHSFISTVLHGRVMVDLVGPSSLRLRDFAHEIEVIVVNHSDKPFEVNRDRELLKISAIMPMTHASVVELYSKEQ